MWGVLEALSTQTVMCYEESIQLTWEQQEPSWYGGSRKTFSGCSISLRPDRATLVKSRRMYARQRKNRTEDVTGGWLTGETEQCPMWLQPCKPGDPTMSELQTEAAQQGLGSECWALGWAC